MVDLAPSKKIAVFKQAQKFERRVRDLLQDIGFADVGGGPQFRLGNSSQIDACGGAGDVLVVVDAHTTVEQRRVSIRNKIRTLRGERSLIVRGMHRHRRYKKYRDVRLVVATRGFRVTPSDRRFASVHPRIHIWDDQVIDYYSKLARFAGQFAKNDLLGELAVDIPSTIPRKALTVPALKTILRGRAAYLFFAKPETLLAISYVARREKGTEQHYQRLVDRSRLAEIGAFLNDRRKRGFFANNVILNFQTRLAFKPLSLMGDRRGLRIGLLRLPTTFRSAWVIDGQHRLYGFTRAGKHARDLDLPVIGFQQLNATKQAELFLEINRSQKAVPPDLIWDLEGEINPNSEFGVISNAVKLLNQRTPLAGMISIPHEGRGGRKHLKLGNICDGILDRGLADQHTESMKVRARNPLYHRKGTRRTQKLSNALREYFTLCASILQPDWSRRRKGFFCTNNGINVLIRVYEACLARYGRRLSKAELRKILRAVHRWLRVAYATTDRLEELRKATSSEGGRADVADKLLASIEERLSLKGLASAKARSPALATRASDLERRLVKYVATAMQREYGSTWVRTRTPPDVLRKLRERRGGSAAPLEQFLTLGECMGIVVREDNWDAIFARSFSKFFRSRDAFRVKFEELMSIRNSAVHRRNDLTQRDHQAFDLYEADLNEAMRTRPRRRTPNGSDSSVQPAATVETTSSL